MKRFTKTQKVATIHIEQTVIPVMRQIVKQPRLSNFLLQRGKFGNPFELERYRDPHPFYEPMRDLVPVVFHKAFQEWIATGHAAAQQLLSSPNTSIARVIETLMNVRPYNKLEPEIQTFFLQWMVLSDEPDHQRLRRLVAKAFTPKRIMSMEPRMTDVANRLLSELPRNDTFLDVARAYTNALPVSVISAMMGVEENQWPVMHRVSMEFTKFLDPRRGFDADVMNNSVNELSVLINELADQRRLDPRDDLVTALVELEGDEDRLTRSELVSMVGMLIFAGHETTDGLLGNALLALARHPTQRRLLMDNPELWPSAIEELIRFDTSVQVDPRVTTSEIQLGDITIPAGIAVSVMIGAANRGPRRFGNPNELRLERFMAEFGEFEADTDAIEWKQTTTLRGPTVLPIKRAPAAAIR